MTADEDERKILAFWKEKKIYERAKEKNRKGKKFYFMDGPPYATGSIHLGTALNKILKDIALRSQRMQGKDVFDRAGYDSHGVPIEIQIEKEIGSKSKKDIEKYGIKRFIKRCEEFATRYIGVMNDEFRNLGVWMDFDNPYITLNDEYMEEVWSTFKAADKKGLLYLGKYPVHICPRCETAVAFNEIEYEKQKDISVYVKFPLKEKGRKKADGKTFLIIWTTTPWTLPGNTGVMVHPDYEYCEVELSSGERWIIAKELVGKIMNALETGYNIKKTFRGKEMKGWKYVNPLADNLKLKLDNKNSYKVVLSGRYVNLEDGTGLVHCAPGHGKEDYEVGCDNKLEMPSPVDINGLLTKEAGKYAGGRAREIDKEIIKDLEKEGCLVYKHEYIHDYPLCWRDKTPLLMVSLPQWFFKISKIQDKLLKENEKVMWIPKWMSSRMKAWLEGLSDWPVSRQRYWGTPLPIWISDDGKEKVVVGSFAELEKLSGKKIKEAHKPEIDEITIKSKSGKILKRVPEVLDVWFDSGVSSWAVFKNYGSRSFEENFRKFWPADLNIEGNDQFRGWWNSQMILSHIKHGRKPFDSIIVHGMVLALGRIKMSKSLNNITSPKEVIDKYGRDAMRYYFAKTSKGEDFDLSGKEFGEVQKVLIILKNVANYILQLNDTERTNRTAGNNGNWIEDKWLISKYNLLVKDARNCYNRYTFPEAVQLMEDFLVNDLSRRYIQLTRERADETKKVLSEVYLGLLKLFSPVIPFMAEMIWQELRKNLNLKEESIHLSEFPLQDLNLVSKDLENNFNRLFEVLEAGLRERDKAQIGLKWPLKSASINAKFQDNEEEIRAIIKRQLNVKQMFFNENKDAARIELDTKLTPELEAEGYAREISRAIQAERKKRGLVKSDEIELEITAPKELYKDIKQLEKLIKERTNSKSIKITDDKDAKKQYTEFDVKGKNFRFFFTK